MIIKPKCKGFICTTAHPEGCYKNVEDMVRLAAADTKKAGGPKNVLVIGSSSGYGLASRIVASFSYHAKSVGVSFEREPSETRTGTAGYYNTVAFEDLAKKAGLKTKSINGDAFSHEIKKETADACKDLFQGEKIDLLIYSLASPKRIDPDTKEVYSSVIKPIGAIYENKTVDFHTGTVSIVAIQPADEEEVQNTIKVMGGEDWQLWVEQLAAEDLLAKDFITVSYSYIGPELTHAVYKDGTIGRAKDDLFAHCDKMKPILEKVNGHAYVSVNKALVTQASSAIPVVPLYISLLYKIMKDKGLHEGCYEQMQRMFSERIYSDLEHFTDGNGRIRMDDYEMREDVQAEAAKLWPVITSENVEQLTDLKGYHDEFFSLFGFGRNDVDYEEDIALI